jgi:hypothetical protein
MLRRGARECNEPDTDLPRARLSLTLIKHSVLLIVTVTRVLYLTYRWTQIRTLQREFPYKVDTETQVTAREQDDLPSCLTRSLASLSSHLSSFDLTRHRAVAQGYEAGRKSPQPHV